MVHADASHRAEPARQSAGRSRYDASASGFRSASRIRKGYFPGTSSAASITACSPSGSISRTRNRLTAAGLMRTRPFTAITQSTILERVCDGSWRPVYEVAGRRVEPGRLYRVRGGWAEPRPVTCPNGHSLAGADRCLVGSIACLRVGGRHRTHACRECGAVVYTPPMRPDCDHSRGHGR